MIKNSLCNSCTFAAKCKAKSKLAVFEEGRKVDLGVTLDFKDCVDYRKAKVTTSEEEDG